MAFQSADGFYQIPDELDSMVTKQIIVTVFHFAMKNQLLRCRGRVESGTKKERC